MLLSYLFLLSTQLIKAHDTHHSVLFLDLEGKKHSTDPNKAPTATKAKLEQKLIHADGSRSQRTSRMVSLL